MTESIAVLNLKPSDPATYRDIMQQRDEYRVQQNAMAQKQQQQQQNAMLQTIYRKNTDASGNINRQGLARDMAMAGLGSNIAGQLEGLGKAFKATGEADNEQYKFIQDLTTDMHEAVRGARNREEALANGERLKNSYPQIANLIQQELGSIPTDPAQFPQWQEKSLRAMLSPDKQLEQDTQTQDLGSSTRVLVRPKYSSAPFAVAPGSEAQKTMTPQQQYDVQRDINNPEVQYIKMEDGSVRAVPKRLGSGGGIPAGRGGGGVPTAGQYGAAIESAAMQLAPGARVSGRGRTPERNAEVGGVADSYHLSDNARDLQPARGQSLDQLAASLAPLKQQGFDVIIERGKNHVHVEPGPGMARGGAAPAAGNGDIGGIKMGQVVPGSGGKKQPSTEAERRFGTVSQNMADNVTDLVNIIQTDPTAIKPGGTEYAAAGIPFIGGEAKKFARSSARRQFEASIQAVLDNITYVNTGAGVTAKQEENYRTSYVPEYSDDDASAKQKLTRLVRYLKNLKSAAGVMWTPENDAQIDKLERAVQAFKIDGGAATSAGGGKKRKSLDAFRK